MVALLWLTLAVPAAAALLVRLLPRASAIAAGVGASAAAAAALGLLIAATEGGGARSAFAWLPAAGLEVGLRLDPLSAVMSATVALVGLAVVVHAGGYFADSPRRPAALAGLLGFLAAMQGLVLADGYLALLFFWEIVGAASARLIAWNRDEPAAPAGAVRAFLTTRSADLGLYAALLALYAGEGTLGFAGERPEGALGALVGIGLVLAAMGKSAQAPIQTWLTGAMAGPTPVSALLHSATMVAAGVYLLVRSEALLEGWPLALAGWVGALTAVVAAAIALAQRDIKRVLAGSTTSQLGLMFVGLAAGGPAVALFHLIAHAAGKAGMFLAVGALQHRRGGETSLEGLRGAGREDRLAFTAFGLGALSIAAVPPLAGFWSKEAVAAAAEQQVVWFVLVLLATAGSAAYLLRPALVLWSRGSQVTSRAQDRGRTAMLVGTGALGVASVGLGVVGGPLASLIGSAPLPSSYLSLALSLLALLAGLAGVLVGRQPTASVAAVARDGFYTGAGLRVVLERPTLAVARLAARADDAIVDRAVDGIARGGLALSRSQEWLERRAIDPAVDGLAGLVGRGGERSRSLQTGRLHEYLRDTVLGAAAVGALVALAALT